MAVFSLFVVYKKNRLKPVFKHPKRDGGMEFAENYKSKLDDDDVIHDADIIG